MTSRLPSEFLERFSYGYGVLITDTPAAGPSQEHWTEDLKTEPLFISRLEKNLGDAKATLCDIQRKILSRHSFVCFSEYSAREIYRFSTTAPVNKETLELCAVMDLHKTVAESDAYCFRFGSPKPVAEGLPLTPIEIYLRRALEEAGLEYSMQVSLLDYVADFVVRVGGRELVVEADGKQYHVPERDQVRDKAVKESLGLDTMRFGGSQLVRNPKSCVQQIKDYFESIRPVTRVFEKEDEDKLDKSQLRAITHSSGPARVLAPAGSGKTKVLINRVVELLNRGARAGGIICLTFDTRARKQLADRLTDLGIVNRRPGQKKSDCVTVATFNSLGASILNGVTTGEPLARQQFQVIDYRSVNRSLFEEILTEAAKRSNTRPRPMRNRDPWASYLDGMASVKRGLRDSNGPDAVMIPFCREGETEELECPIGGFLDAFDSACRSRSLITFDDQIYLACRTLFQDASLRHTLQNTFTHVLVDEYQDLNPAQIALLRILVARNQEVFCVGDDDQMIYSWRQVAPDNIVNFDQIFDGMSDYQLETNYRSSKKVITRSQNLIQWNVDRIPKNVNPGPKNKKGKVEVFAGESIDSQLGRMVLEIKENKSNSHIAYSDFAVLSRLKAHHLKIARALDQADIPRQKIKDVVLYSSPVASYLLAYLQICVSPERATTNTFKRIINRPNRYLTNEFVNKRLAKVGDPYTFLKRSVEEISERADPTSMRLGTQSAQRGPKVASRQNYFGEEMWRSEHLKRFIGTIDRISAGFGDLTPADAIDMVVKEFVFIPAEIKSDQSADDADAATSVEIIREDAKSKKSLGEFIDYMLFMREAEQEGTDGLGIDPQADEKTDYVTISTIHGGKGLEWKNVILFDCSNEKEQRDGVSPEERRVFYVAMTRAIEDLVILTRKEAPSTLIEEAFVLKALRSSAKPGKETKAGVAILKKKLTELYVSTSSARLKKEKGDALESELEDQIESIPVLELFDELAGGTVVLE